MGRLLDISRSTIVFQNMTDLTNALGLIVTDDNVGVLLRVLSQFVPVNSKCLGISLSVP